VELNDGMVSIFVSTTGPNQLNIGDNEEEDYTEAEIISFKT